MSKKPTQDPYLKACALLGETPKPVLADRSNSDEVSIDAYARLIVCIRAKNMIDGKIWIAKYDGTEWHYYPRWRWTKTNAGSGFAYVYYVYWDSFTYVGERLEYRTYELMKEGVVEFKEYYDAYLTPYKPKV